jgi:hypothetical protein
MCDEPSMLDVPTLQLIFEINNETNFLKEISIEL